MLGPAGLGTRVKFDKMEKLKLICLLFMHGPKPAGVPPPARLARASPVALEVPRLARAVLVNGAVVQHSCARGCAVSEVPASGPALTSGSAVGLDAVGRLLRWCASGMVISVSRIYLE